MVAGSPESCGNVFNIANSSRLASPNSQLATTQRSTTLIEIISKRQQRHFCNLHLLAAMIQRTFEDCFCLTNFAFNGPHAYETELISFANEIYGAFESESDVGDGHWLELTTTLRTLSPQVVKKAARKTCRVLSLFALHMSNSQINFKQVHR